MMLFHLSYKGIMILNFIMIIMFLKSILMVVNM